MWEVGSCRGMSWVVQVVEMFVLFRGSLLLFGTWASDSLGSSGKGMGLADHVYRAVFHQICGLQSLDGYGHEDLIEDRRAFDCASEAWMKAHTRTITGHDYAHDSGAIAMETGR